MSQLNRAKIFAPFAALVGFDERVRRKEINYVAKHELDADEEWELNHKLFGSTVSRQTPSWLERT